MQMNTQRILGLICAILASFCWPLFGLVIKQIYLETNISSYAMAYFRTLMPLVLIIPYAAFTGIDIIHIPKQISVYFFIRVCFWVLGLIMNFCSLKYITLSKSTIIFFTGPIITSILSYFIVNEQLSAFDIIGCISSFIGVLIVATDRTTNKQNPAAGSEPWWAFIFPIFWALFNAIGDTYQRKFAQAISPLTVQIWMYIISMAFIPSIPIVLRSDDQKYFTGFSVRFVVEVVIASFIGICALSLYLTALKYEKAGRVAAINYLQVFNSILIDVFYFGVEVRIRNILGAVLIVACSFSITLLKAFDIIK
eukprot:TRINITY_DN528_c0_g1_i2.p1 TRINITY_DN528_c0_g1~~TRINITY_DN528_c0_g1_i2.p1  ORF type:complete len:309 (+),score=30.79 TRINITY_DN528_c0_g1_i2:63-989(+)